VALVGGTIGLGVLVVLVGLLGGGVTSPTADDPPSSAEASGSEMASSTPHGSGSPVTSIAPTPREQVGPGASCAEVALAVDCFARVTVDALKLRTGPGLDAPQVLEGVTDGPPNEVVIGRANGRDQVYIADGPVQADSLAWYQVGVMNNENEQATDPLYVGWVASGDLTDPWLIPEDPCPPAGPVELADVIFARFETAWAIHLGCFRDQVLTLRGWFPILPSDFEIPYDTDGSCFAEPAFLMCGSWNKDIRPGARDFFDRSTERLNFTIDPAAGAELPERGQWIEITGAFDHPAAHECGPDAGSILPCRAVFVVTDISVSP
jgi:hypothetical protein